MPLHTDWGKQGEELAASWLRRKGFIILHRNWRSGRYEIDIIAVRGRVHHFIEVKYRRSLLYGQPEESVGREKIKNMMKGAAAWRRAHRSGLQVQYDVLSILCLPEKPPEFFFIGDISA